MFFIIFAIFIGIMCTIGGIQVVSDANKDLKKCRKAVVIRCDESVKKNSENSVQYYDICFEMESERGIVQKTVRVDKYCQLGSEHEVCFDEEKDSIELVSANFISDIKKKKKDGLFCTIAFVLTYLLVGSGVLINKYGSEFMWLILGGFVLILCFVYAIIGVCSIVKKNKTYNDLDVYRVPGRVIDNVHHGANSYTPIYEFYDNGVRRTIKASTADGERVSVRRTVGKNVVIVVNRKTKEAYCEEDNRRQKYINLYLIAVLVVIIVCVVWSCSK